MPRITTFDGHGNIIATEDVPDDPIDVATRTIEDKLRAALTSNKTFQAIASPTAAQRNQQIDRLTRQVNALIRRELRALADTTDV